MSGPRFRAGTCFLAQGLSQFLKNLTLLRRCMHIYILNTHEIRSRNRICRFWLEGLGLAGLIGLGFRRLGCGTSSGRSFVVPAIALNAVGFEV